MIDEYDRVYVSCVGEYGCVSEIIKTGVPGIVKYRVEFADGWSGIYGAHFVQPMPRRVVRAVLRLVIDNGARP